MGRYLKRTRKREKAFLEALESGLGIGTAAKAAKVCRRTVLRWREEDDEFAADWDAAVETANDVLEDELRRRALEGIETPIFHGGNQIATIRKYSDKMLSEALERRRPKSAMAAAGPQDMTEEERIYAELNDPERFQKYLLANEQWGEEGS